MKSQGEKNQDTFVNWNTEHLIAITNAYILVIVDNLTC